MTDLSVPLVTALCALAAHRQLHKFRTGYGLSRAQPDMVGHRTIAALARLGFATESRARTTPGAIGRARLTQRGAARLLAGHHRSLNA